MKKNGILFLLMLISVSIFAQNQVVVRGQIVNQETSNELSLVYVFVSPGNKHVVTDSKGNFKISLTQGDYFLNISHLGFDRLVLPLKIDRNTPSELNLGKIGLKSQPIFLSGVDIIGTGSGTGFVKMNSITQDQIQTRGGGELGEHLRSIPNVSGVRRGGAVLDPVVRGFKYSQLSVYIDGLFHIEGGCPNRMDPTVSRVDAHDVERIEVVKGPFALRYGPNFGGAIRLVTHNPKMFNDSKIQYNVNAFTEFTPYLGSREHLRVDAGNNKMSFMVFGGKTDIGNFKDGNGDLLKTQALKYNYGIKSVYRIADKHFIKFTYNNLTGKDVLFAALPMDERSDETWFSHIDYLGVLPFESNKSVSFSVYYADVFHVMDNFNRPISDTVAAVSSVNAITQGAKLKTVWKLPKNAELTSGLDVQRIIKDGERVRTMIAQAPNPMGKIPQAREQLWNNAIIDNLGFYSEYNQKIGSHNLFAALRFDLNQATSDDINVKHPSLGEIYTFSSDSTSSSFFNTSFSAGYSYDFNEKLTAGIVAGQGVRSPDMLERYIILLPVGFDNYDYLGNPNLKPETNREVDLSIRYEDFNLGAVEFIVFYSHVSDFIIGNRIPPSVQRPLSLGVLGVKQYTNADFATFSGFEFAVNSPQNRKLVFSANAAYTMGTIYEIQKAIIDPSLPLAQQVIGDTLLTNDPLSEIPPLEANFKVQANLLERKLSLEFHTRYVASQKRVSSAMYEKETPDVLLLNFSARYLLKEGIYISGGINNLLDTYYYEHLNRRMIGSSSKIYEPGRMFFVNLSLKF